MKWSISSFFATTSLQNEETGSVIPHQKKENYIAHAKCYHREVAQSKNDLLSECGI